MKLQVCFVDQEAKTAAWLDFEPEMRLPTTDGPDDVCEVVSNLTLPEGMEGLRVITSKGVWTFQYHPTYGCVPRLREEMGEVQAIWPTNAEVGGVWTIQHVLPDSHTIELVYVEGESQYMMGDDQSPTRRKVSVPAGFIGKYPVTVREWNYFAKATGKPLKATTFTAPSGKTYDITDHPVTEVSYWDARAFADWAGIGLPTEEQWEHAARGNDGRKYPWGNEPPTDELCHSSVKTQKETTDAVTNRPKGASPYGAQDMAGNTWEWTATIHK